MQSLPFVWSENNTKVAIFFKLYKLLYFLQLLIFVPTYCKRILLNIFPSYSFIVDMAFG